MSSHKVNFSWNAAISGRWSAVTMVKEEEGKLGTPTGYFGKAL